MTLHHRIGAEKLAPILSDENLAEKIKLEVKVSVGGFNQRWN